ncbi:hypothetical protein LNP26_00225 [Klebsiella variicola subsp. variicola]|nr:hypothetical protein [Klebsiella variicola subsp. variicola]
MTTSTSWLIRGFRWPASEQLNLNSGQMRRWWNVQFQRVSLFIGLFNFANDMGCFERSPKRLKMQIFPADALDCEPLIQELITHGLLTEYSVNDVCYLQIKGFLKHQK